MRNSILVILIILIIITIIGCSKNPDINQIKADLIGQVIGNLLNNYKFESVESIQELIINKKNNQNDIIEYDVNILMNDFISEEQYRANLLLVYRKTGGSWEIVSLSTKLFEQVISEEELSTEAQYAIAALRQTYRFHFQTYGSTTDYDIEAALKDAMLGNRAEKNWDFEVMGNPPLKYIATSTADFSAGEGKQVWFDVEEAKYHGYGIDE